MWFIIPPRTDEKIKNLLINTLNWKGGAKSPKVQEEEAAAARLDEPACDACNNIDHPELAIGTGEYECNPAYCDFTDNVWPMWNTCRPKACCVDRTCNWDSACNACATCGTGWGGCYPEGHADANAYPCPESYCTWEEGFTSNSCTPKLCCDDSTC